ncbi:UNVERIFIED_CONTAM: hypothetical protein PYX00_006909 [Menopon gallinae]|uniref:Reverse transcriptase domain-containing protein n=1 Tax=Menopon gallinae TaxID=328185 RepID=A0AAW2HH13_9NEOP
MVIVSFSMLRFFVVASAQNELLSRRVQLSASVRWCHRVAHDSTSAPAAGDIFVAWHSECSSKRQLESSNNPRAEETGQSLGPAKCWSYLHTAFPDELEEVRSGKAHSGGLPIPLGTIGVLLEEVPRATGRTPYPSSAQAQEELYFRVEEAYLKAKAHMCHKLQKLPKSGSSELSKPPLTTGRLPKISLPIFSGDFLHWENFRVLLRCIVHEAPDLSDAARLQYLKSSLTGEAAQLVSSIPITDGNYAGAWTALAERYDDPRTLMAHHFNHLLSLKGSSSESSSHAQMTATRVCKPTPLATAVVGVTAPHGNSARVRALLDQGSEATFISEDVAQRLKLRRSRVHIPVSGMGAAHCGRVKAMPNIQLSSDLEGYTATFNAGAMVLPQLMPNIRPLQITSSSWPHLATLSLSDSDPSSSANIDLVIGADLYGHILLDGLIKGPPGTPPEECLSPVSSLHCSVDLSLTEQFRRFWEIEEIATQTLLTPEDQFCQNHFETTHARDATGKLVVRLPRRSDLPLGDSYSLALRSFRIGELQRQRNPSLGLAYQNFMEEYIRLGNMSPIAEAVRSTETFYLPHHAVWKQEGDNSKLRVVFNASARTTSGHSLNNTLLPGPKLQQDLSHIILRWRTYSVVFTADIVKMFRQIWVDPRDQPLQRILWRNSPAEELQEFQLQTVTYGTACAPFLAIRTLLQLAPEGAHQFPKASASLSQQTYVDDILTGADTLEEALELKRQLETLLMAGGFELAKCAPNSGELASNAPRNHGLSDGTIKTLGLHWNPAFDVFGFQVQLEDHLKTITKRSILSSISRLFDPLGWSAPVLVTAKVFLQDLWSVKVDWDAALPKELEESWSRYYTSLQDLQDIQIPRWIHTRAGSPCELHGFSDGSQRAYAASVYLRTETAAGTVQTHLLVAKMKVAPLKVISLPRLELSGTVLLVCLLQNVCAAPQFSSSSPCIHAWTDSQVVLHWISAVPARWKCFVANRVSEIHETLPQAIWHHVQSSDNPADPASRGLPAAALRQT